MQENVRIRVFVKGRRADLDKLWHEAGGFFNNDGENTHLCLARAHYVVVFFKKKRRFCKLKLIDFIIVVCRSGSGLWWRPRVVINRVLDP